ncbi:MFS transporter [Haloplanus halophilus]|uniref:MFS transporter n=1 Tax=Haloplanus halophilus TaxID=2949993 RepID=UPI00204248A7|nr:MFS transporter [Haloplanus sp. GDY1]
MPTPLTAVRRFVAGLSRHASDRWLYAWALGYAAVGAASLLVPLYAVALGADPFVVGLVEAAAGLAGVPGALVWGRLADRTGNRRGFVLGGLFGAGVVLALFPRLTSPRAVVLLNAALWFVVSAASPVVTLFMIEGTPEREWGERIGLLNAFQRYGWVGGLVGGTLWLGVGAVGPSVVAAQRGLFLLCAAASVVATPLAFYWLPPETTTSPRRLGRSSALGRLVAGGRYAKLVAFVPLRAVRVRRPSPRRLLSRFPSGLRRYFLVAALFSTAFSVFFGPLPVFLADLQYPDTLIFGLFIVSNAVSAIVFVPVGRLTARIDPAALQVRALGVRTLLFPAFGLAGGLAAWWLRTGSLALGFAVVGLTWAVVAVTGAALVSRAAPAPLRGEALGVYTALSGVGAGVGGVLGGALARVAGYAVAFGAAGLLVGCSAAVLLTTDLTGSDA